MPRHSVWRCAVEHNNRVVARRGFSFSTIAVEFYFATRVARSSPELAQDVKRTRQTPSGTGARAVSPPCTSFEGA